MRLRIVFVLTILLLLSCQKVAINDDLPYCYFSFKENGTLIDFASFKSENAVFSSAWRHIGSQNENELAIWDHSMSQFHYATTRTPTRTSQIEPELVWVIDSYYIEDGKKYYCDTSLVKKKEQFSGIYLGYNVIGSSGLWTLNDKYVLLRGKDLLWGWMSFSRNTDNTDIILRVSFEADYVSGKERKDTLRYRDGRIDFTTKMANKIIGGERLR